MNIGGDPKLSLTSKNAVATSIGSTVALSDGSGTGSFSSMTVLPTRF